MADANKQDQMNLSSDGPKVDPADDAFGYSSFAKRIEEAVRRTPSPQGLVMAIHGPWGSGKSTLLNFTKFYLNESHGDGIMIIDFNPWWFNDKNHLATQFLSQFKSKLSHESEILRGLGDVMADYSGALGKAVAVGYGVPLLDKPIGIFLKWFKRKDKDIPTLKSEIAAALKKANQRFLFVIDDIDRLPPDEICELFKVIKALADFPNVIYLLSFDRDMVAQSLSISLGVDGNAYLEKIVQVPFSLPSIDPLRLRQRFVDELNRLFDQFPPASFDQEYWSNVFFEGIEHLINKPRDVVRFINVLTVTYPAVAGEVNPIDFIALEFLRVFEPIAYSTIRDNKEMFAGRSWSKDDEERKRLSSFHDSWLEKISDTRRRTVREIISQLFPLVRGAWDNVSHGSEYKAIWRKDLRVASEELFDIYFQFGVSPDSLSRSELDQLIASGADAQSAISILMEAARILRPNGQSKARDYLERLRDFKDEISTETAGGLLVAMFAVGDMLLNSADEGGGFMSFPNRWRYRGLVENLLARVAEQDRTETLKELVKNGKAISLIVDLVAAIESNLEKKVAGPASLAQIDSAAVVELRTLAIGHLEGITSNELLGIPDMAYVMHYWTKWGGEAAMRTKFAPLIALDDQLPIVLEKFTRFGTTSGIGDKVSQRTYHLNPQILESITDIAALEIRIVEMLKRTDLTLDQRGAGESYLRSMERIRKGQNPDGMFSDD